MCPGNVLPHWPHLLSFGARQRCDALRVRRRIFEVFLLGTPISVDLLQFQLIQRAPHIRFFGVWLARGFGLSVKRAWAFPLAIPVAMRMGRKGEQNVFPYRLCQVHGFSFSEFHLAGELRDVEWIDELLETYHALRVEIDPDIACGKKTAPAEPYIQRVMHWPCWLQQGITQL